MNQIVRHRSSLCAAILLLGAVVSCGHDAPTQPQITPEALAHQLDSLATATQQAGNLQGSMAFSQAAVALRNGVATSKITIVEGTTSDQYNALAIRFDPGATTNVSSPAGTDTYGLPAAWVLVAWQSDLPTGRVIAITALPDSATLDTIGVVQTETGPEIEVPTGFGFMFDAGELHLVAVHGTAVLSPLQSLGQCETSSQNTDAAAGTVTSGIPSLPPLTCTRWSFTGHFDITFQPTTTSFPFTPQAGAPTSTFAMSSQSVNGIRLTPDTTP